MVEREKTRKLIAALAGYFLYHAITEFEIKVRMSDHETQISINGKSETGIDGINEMCIHLSDNRMHEIETYYDELLGMRNSDDELKLMSYFVDDAKCCYENQVLTLTIVRKH